ncbi:MULTISPECIES: DUF4129 domain-containing protein [Streptomyces]|uniref:DUF4129 domain-containing protein n=1 Tax=unclassified Streptomyces TaxID=2593676 RepID=UPI00159E12C2|nr:MULTISPECIES: DUF4129 domain-containing protein [Streptomyces]
MAAAGGVAVPLAVRTGDEVPVRTPRLPAREAAERELSESVYHQNDPSLFRRALDRFWEWLDTLFDAAAGVTPGGPAGLAVILAVVLLLAVALRLRLGPLRPGPESPGALFPDDRPRSAAEHRAEAERHAAAQRWEQAVQEHTRALVRSLEERALLTPRPGRTADEAATEAGRPLPGHADRLRAAARDFDDVTYGGRRTTAETYARLRDLDQEIRHSKPVLAPVATGDAS